MFRYECEAKCELNSGTTRQLNREVDSGEYVSASEVIREALRDWLNRRIQANVAALEKAHAGAWARDTTPEELEAILKAKQRARVKLSTGKKRNQRMR